MYIKHINAVELMICIIFIALKMYLIKALEDKVIILTLLNWLPELKNMIIVLLVNSYFSDPYHIMMEELKRVAISEKLPLHFELQLRYQYYNSSSKQTTYECKIFCLLSKYCMKCLYHLMISSNSGIICYKMRHQLISLRLIIHDDGYLSYSNTRSIKLHNYSFTTSVNKLKYVEKYKINTIYPLFIKHSI